MLFTSVIKCSASSERVNSGPRAKCNKRVMISKWLMTTVALLVVDVRTGALQQATIEPQRCYSCVGNATSPCDQSSRWSTVLCPTALPVCATTAASPDFISSLSCAAVAESPCSLQNTPRQTYQLTCLCTSELCNTPFTMELREQLLNTSYSLMDKFNDTAKQTEMFFNLSTFANVSESDIYRAVTVELAINNTSLRNMSEFVTSTPMVVSTQSLKHTDNVPRAEALKQETTAPSDDDEDETEGSGSYEERQPPPASPPAAPSSYLPAENTAPSLLNAFFTTLLFVPIIV